VRDLDVLLGSTLAETEAAHADDASLKALYAAAEAARGEAQAELREILQGERYGDLVLQLSAWIARHGWREQADADTLQRQREPILDYAAEVLQQRYRQAMKAGRGFRKLSPAEHHKLRIALKKLRYGLEFFEGLFPGKRLKRMRKAASSLQDQLGHLNDVEVARGLVREVAGRVQATPEATEVALGGGVLLGRQAARLEDLAGDALKAWRDFRSRKPAWKRWA
jgi:CHAD domain-containing protein